MKITSANAKIARTPHANPLGLSAASVLIVGFIAAFGAGKLPAVLPAIQAELGMTLVHASVLVGMFQFAGALGGVFAGALADRFGHRRLMLAGLTVMAVGSLLGASASGAIVLLLSRAVESLGFIMAVLPGPALLRQVVSVERLNRWLGIWGTYMPTGFACGLLAAPLLADGMGWRSVWVAHALLAVAGYGLLLRYVPLAATPAGSAKSTARAGGFGRLLGQTLRSAGPWLLALSFMAYAGQYLSIISFLPTIYQQAGIAAGTAGLMTALAALINVLGNVSAGQLIHRGVSPAKIIAVAALTLIIGAWLVFASPLPFTTRYFVVLGVSAVMGMVPGSLFVLSTQYAPAPQAVSTTVGLMQQGSAFGQLIMPVLVAWVATMSVGWHNTWLVTGAFALSNLLLAGLMWRRDQRV